ncbi:MAG: hypothetical protein QXF12_07910 [Candidatus Aenigmatarchaeota archaeon]
MLSERKIIKKIHLILEKYHINIIEYVLFKIIGYSSHLDPSMVYATYIEYIISNNRESFSKILFGFIKKMIEEHQYIAYKKMSTRKRIANFIYKICLTYGLKVSKRKIMKFVNVMFMK